MIPAMPAGRRPRRRALLGGGVALALLAGAPARAQAPATVSAQDPADALENAPDLKRVGATRLADGDVRLSVSLVDEIVPEELLSERGADGPPGSVCVRLWTLSTPRTTPPDLLACVTARSTRALRATITREEDGAPPTVVASPALTRPSGRSFALRVPKALLGRATRLRFAAEATQPGCPRLSCVDLAPDLGAVKVLHLTR